MDESINSSVLSTGAEFISPRAGAVHLEFVPKEKKPSATRVRVKQVSQFSGCLIYVSTSMGAIALRNIPQHKS